MLKLFSPISHCRLPIAIFHTTVFLNIVFLFLFYPIAAVRVDADTHYYSCKESCENQRKTACSAEGSTCPNAETVYNNCLIPCGEPPTSDTSGTSSTAPSKPITLTNPLSGTATALSISSIVGRVIKVVFGITGSIALLMFVIGGMYFLLSAGESERIKKGTEIIKWSVIGLIVIFASYIILNFVFTSLAGLGT